MEQDAMLIMVGGAGVLVVSLLVMLLVFRRLLYVVAPNQILVLSGRPRRLADGRIVGYRIVTGGRAIRLPIIERADIIDGTALTVAFEVSRAYSRDGVPLDLSATATVRPCRTEDELSSYVERFLGRSREEVGQVARQTLEGHLRTLVAALSAAELRTDREMLKHHLVEEADHDLSKMGLQVEALVLQDVAPLAPARVPD